MMSAAQAEPKKSSETDSWGTSCLSPPFVVTAFCPVYALVVDRSPPKINVSAPSVNDILISPRELEDGTTAVQFSHTTMPEFTEFLMGWIQDRQIVDETHLNGRFDFTVMIPTSSLGGSDNDKATAFLLGVKPLGFKLDPKKEPLELIVIDNIDKPTAN